ncbi:hypothetical protein LU689_11440 [Pseudomonas asiatica]|uniref:hypothetical protein n=1 Tax=Pseudomonas asiatica TaxID=2219225 RepID=UPI001E3D792C|nr:hypothetical protein [Pseudomonas asiatica]MCE0850527.1 hypothetical protein [Pseudomonas asiatica]
MDTNKMREMREAFERTNSRDHRRQPPKGNNYIDPMAQADWESFQKGWVASREAVVIVIDVQDGEVSVVDIESCAQEQGIRVEVLS